MANSQDGKLMGKGQQQAKQATPRKQPNVLPPAHVGGHDHSFTLQAIMEMQRTLGQLVEATESLKRSADEQRKEIKGHGYIIAGASAATTVVLMIGGYFIDKMWDKLAAIMAIAPPP